MEIEDLLDREDIPEDVIKAIQRSLANFKEIERKLRESEEQYRNVVDRANDGIAILQDSLIKYVNSSLIEITGYSFEDLYNSPFIDYIHPDSRSEVMDRYKKRISGIDVPTIYETKLLLKNNETLEVEINAGLITYQGRLADLAIVRDVTKHKQAEKELGKSKEKYQMLVEKLEEGVLLEDAEGKISFVNPKTAELLGYTEKELLGQHWEFIVPQEYIDKIISETSKRPEGVGTNYEASLLAKDGQHIPVIITATPIFSQEGEFGGVLSVFTDISDRKAVEQKLRESEERYRSYIQNARDIIFSISFDGKITSLNPVMEFITGWHPDEWIGKPFLPLIHEEDLPLILEGFENILNRARFPAIEARLLKKTGDYVPVEIKASPQIQEGEIKGMLGIARNITQRKQVEEALRQVKLEEERYHAMMSHFVNNDMQKIINNLELVLLMYESNLELNSNIVNDVIAIASGSSKTIDMVNHIFEILQTPFVPKDSKNLLGVVKDVISDFSDYTHLINVNEKNLDTRIFTDTHLNDVFYELMEFILYSYAPRITETPIEITGSYFPSFYSVFISDYCSEPLTQDVVLQLSGQITDDWEVIGHHIGIALVSVIMQYYGGVLKIKSSDPKGNVFELRFPKELIETKAIEL
ncbi:MAG: PAS domain S-box protein [Candidatus Heimdallarchaeota archaeon]|nr:MAG: PAS domain S-box protein [Candidatus Heimdallarchaeota archaeon]